MRLPSQASNVDMLVSQTLSPVRWCPFVMFDLSFQMHVSDRATHFSKSIYFHLGEVQPSLYEGSYNICYCLLDRLPVSTPGMAYLRVPIMHGEKLDRLFTGVWVVRSPL